MKRFIVLAVLVSLLLSLFVVSAIAQGVKNVELHGYMLNRFYAGPDNPSKFIVERVSLSATGQISDTITGYTEVYFHPSLASSTNAQTYVESAYVDMPLAGGRVRFGKGRQLNFGMTPTYPNRKTTQYGIVSETFTQDRIIGAQYSYKKGALDFGTTVSTDYRIGTRPVGGYSGAIYTVPHFVNKDVPADTSKELAVSAKVGITHGSLRGHVSGYTGQLVQADANTIAGAYGISTTNRNHNMYGADATYSMGPVVLQGQWYQGNFSFLKITGYSALIGYEPKNSRRLYLRYEALNNDNTPTANPLTWDTQQLTFGFVQPIANGVWAEINYEKNMESPAAGSSDVNNDLLFLEIFTGF